jgi:class 3 adenylate cyclase
MFADLVGFTAWSSVREPSQVFILLETVYHAFDQIAKRRGVFKVKQWWIAMSLSLGTPRAQDHAVVNGAL